MITEKGGFPMKNRLFSVFLIYFGFTIVSNFVHSITPAFLQIILGAVSITVWPFR